MLTCYTHPFEELQKMNFTISLKINEINARICFLVMLTHLKKKIRKLIFKDSFICLSKLQKSTIRSCFLVERSLLVLILKLYSTVQQPGTSLVSVENWSLCRISLFCLFFFSNRQITFNYLCHPIDIKQNLQQSLFLFARIYKGFYITRLIQFFGRLSPDIWQC